jgi:hypothetical protein
MSLGGAKGDVKYDRRGRLCNSAGVIGGPFSSGTFTSTVLAQTGFANTNASSVSVSNSSFVQNGYSVQLYLKGNWVPNATSSTATVSVPTTLLPRAGVSPSPIGILQLNGTDAAQTSGLIGTFTAASGTTPANISMRSVCSSTPATASTYCAVIQYNI